MNNKSPKVSILIRCLNEYENLKILLNLLNNQTYNNFEVVFLDSGSTDNSINFVQNFKSNYKISFNQISKSKFTFGRALNKCIEYSNSPNYVISLSAHCFPVRNDFVENYVNFFKNKNVKIVYGKQSGYKNSRLSEASHLERWFGNNYGVQIESPFTNNGNCAYDIEIFKKFKFNEKLTGCEDIEFALKVLKANGDIVYGSGVEVFHYHKENLKQIYNRFYREAKALRIILPYKYNILDFIKHFIKKIFTDLQFKSKVKKYQSRSLIEILSYNFMQFLGFYMGYNGKLDLNSKIYNNSDEKLVKSFYKHYLN